MNATDELRRLLDERGIEWKGFEGDPLGFVKAETAWGEVDGLGTYSYWIAEYFDGTTLLNIGNPTPEQAVEATLGRGTCRITVEDNLAETEGTGDVWLECSVCHWQMLLEPTTPRFGYCPPLFSYCPNCGRKVVGA